MLPDRGTPHLYVRQGYSVDVKALQKAVPRKLRRLLSTDSYFVTRGNTAGVVESHVGSLFWRVK